MTSQDYRDAYEIGKSRGYTHASYVDAYDNRLIEDADEECERLDDDGERFDAWPLARNADMVSGYGTGYRDGIDAFLVEQQDEEFAER